MRLRNLLPIVVALLLSAAANAFASKTETGASGPAETMSGWDWVGHVTVAYAFTSERGQREDGPPQIASLRFANECDKHGSLLTRAITVGRSKRFHFRGGSRGLDFTVTGNVIGSLGNPREVAGFASVRGHGCASGPWWFDAYPGTR
jgi:hypothetical protein